MARILKQGKFADWLIRVPTDNGTHMGHCSIGGLPLGIWAVKLLPGCVINNRDSYQVGWPVKVLTLSFFNDKYQMGACTNLIWCY